MGRFVTLLLGLFSATLLVACLVVHVLSWIPGTVLPLERIIWLHVLVLAACFLVCWHAATLRKRALRRGCRPSEVQKVMHQPAPRGSWVVLAVFLYVVLNFTYFVVTVEGTARIRDDKYVLTRKSTFIRELSEAEYHENRRFQVRGMSGHWILFAGFATGYFLLSARHTREELAALPAGAAPTS